MLGKRQLNRSSEIHIRHGTSEIKKTETLAKKSCDNEDKTSNNSYRLDINVLHLARWFGNVD